MKNIRIFHLKIFIFLLVKFSVYLNGRVFVMTTNSFFFFFYFILIWNFYINCGLNIIYFYCCCFFFFFFFFFVCLVFFFFFFFSYPITRKKIRLNGPYCICCSYTIIIGTYCVYPKSELIAMLAVPV